MLHMHCGRGLSLDRPPAHTRCHCCTDSRHVTHRAMAPTKKQKAACVIWYAKWDSIVKVRREYARVYNVYKKNAPGHKSILRWFRKFQETGSVEARPKSGRRHTSRGQIRKIKDKFERSPKTSMRRAALQLGIRKSTIHSVLRNTLHFTGYKLQLRHQIKPADKPNRLKFCVNMYG